ncbi:MOSC domain-containing protein [Palleronia pelagia]|uniref:MOSC domain-containing protein n=1 Tax=Palleronia pelagia TaxID=387096 RepID=A0A1H8JCC7_9RHOB|nr:MOSC domain-containing protein [Palleronia pelagia]SEN78369.1 MOSC domain-containing protein [Palleronia pelagia]
MPVLEPTDHTCTVVWLGRVAHRDRPAVDGAPVDIMPLDFGGMAGEHHAGVTRASCSRVTALHPKGTEIANVRQLSILSQEELDAIAADMGTAPLDPAWLGASLVVKGIDDFTHLPPSSRLQGADGATLVIDMLNQPCQFPAMSITEARGDVGKTFKQAADLRRGVTAWVERPGTLRLGDTLRLFVPGQRAWRGGRQAEPATRAAG